MDTESLLALEASSDQWRRQCDLDWMWWVFMVGMDIDRIAQVLEVRRFEVISRVDSIFSGVHKCTIEQVDAPCMDRHIWIPRHDKILVRLKEAGCSLERASRLLARSPEKVKQHMKQLAHG